ncbi:hypothetical protein Tco_0006455 [Tanacetum coccineum]
MRSLRAVGSTIHSMIKFLTNQGVVTMETSREAIRECKHLERVQGLASPEKTWGREDAEEVFTIDHERLDMYVTMGATLTTNYKQLLADGLRENMEWFIRDDPEGRLSLKEKVFRWLKEGLIKKVQHPEWIPNAIPIKLANGTWKVRVDYSSLNKVCARDMYPFPEEGEELTSLMGYPYKCFLRLSKEYSQIRMKEDDEEKTGFHTEEGVYCFTHILKELKNSPASL